MRLLDDMETERARLSERASAYKMAGSAELARLAHKAAYALLDANRALAAFHAAEGEELNRQKEC